MAFCHRSIFQSGSLHLLLHFSSLAALFCPPSGSATHHSLTQLSFWPLSFLVTYFAEVRHFEMFEYLIFTNIYCVETKEHWLHLILWHKNDLGEWEGNGKWWLMLLKKGRFVGKRSFWLYIIVQIKYFYNVLLVFECVWERKKKEMEREKVVEITLHVIIAHHGCAAEQNDWILLQWFHICMC